MKSTFSTVSIIAIALILTAGYDSGVRKGGPKQAVKVSIVESPAQVVTIHDYKLSTVSPYVVAETLSPKLESNFNELVKFPELGSSSEESGFDAVIRGPPKIS